MPALSAAQRSTLEKTVVAARQYAETGARNALRALAVDQPEPYVHTTADQRALRNRLRAKARLLGDTLQTSGHQDIEHLAYELAYEYWHRMLFAKFLEANHLLIHPEGVAVTMEDCAELAPEEGYADKWTAAAAYASRMLPALFRPDDPLMQVDFATEDRIQLETLLDGIPNDTFTADDSLGWVYQFWQNEAKAAINAGGDKINGARLPAVTQLFTEPYMVHFLLDNTLGAWWTSRHPGETPPVKFEYLRLLDDGTPSAGRFEGWPDRTSDITTLDPCMGSGHFVAALFPVLARLRMHEEGLNANEAADRVIAENLHGLELDPRCTQIAAFNLALTAWKFCGRYKSLPEMNLACSGIAPQGKPDDWVKLAGSNTRVRNGINMLFQLFRKAPELGSLLEPDMVLDNSMAATAAELEPALENVIEQEKAAQNEENAERGVMALGIASAAKILSQKYTLQITNVPYLARGKQAAVLAEYCEKNYPDAKGDLATAFLDRMLKNAAPGGTVCSVIPQNWLFLTSYRKFREKLLKTKSWSIVARLGPKGFQTPMWDFNVMLVSIHNATPQADHTFFGLDVSEAPNAAEKDAALRQAVPLLLNQKGQLGNPDVRVVLEGVNMSDLIEKIANSLQGIKTGDDPRYSFKFWEISLKNEKWKPFQNTTNDTMLYGGLSDVVFWENDGSYMSRRQGLAGWGKKGIAISRIGSLPCSIHLGFIFNSNVSALIPKDESILEPLWVFCSSPEYSIAVRKIDQALAVTNKAMEQVGFDLAYWQKVATEKYPNGLPQPYSDDPTQWLFHGHPAKAERPLQVALARLLGYRWPAESDPEMELAPEARELIQAVQAFNPLSDEDGIVCIPPVNGEYAGAERLRAFLQAVYGAAWSNATLAQLLAQEGSKKTNLEDWLREEFFEQHFKLFHHRPFLWHIWDGRKDGFSAIVNYHRLTKENLQKLIYTYLGDWLRQCDTNVKAGESGADGLRSAARKLKEKLELILEGEAPYDIFVRWKPLHQQPLGWDPDLNDGVRLNIRPFLLADVLRKKPNIKWGVDRGKNPPGSPWGEVRDNDRHLGLEEKRAAREEKK